MNHNQTFEFVPGKVTTLNTYLEKPSPFYFGYDIQESFMSELEKYSFDQIFFFTEPHLFQSYGKELYDRISEKYTCSLEFVPPGEKCKYFPILEQTCEKLIAKGASKKTILIAFGGGTVGNVVGLAAGLVYRGLRFIEVPTSMTGQTDSTLSNKQAVNGTTGKNHFGLYHSPIFIWSDTKYLKTEPPSSKRSGIIEGIKNGFISDPTFLEYLEETLNPELNFTDEKLTELAYKIILSKLPILQEDPSEKGYGITLEYGHTFGHAIEWIEGGKMSHGEAVSFGMKIAAELERVADIAVSIAERSAGIAQHGDFPMPSRLNEMTDEALSMLHDSIDAFVEQNSAAARVICQRDERVDKLNSELIAEVVNVMKQRPELVEPSLHLFSVIRHVERVADHATNIAEDVVYLVDAAIIRHPRLNR